MTEVRTSQSLPLDLSGARPRLRLLDPPLVAILVVAALVGLAIRLAPIIEGDTRLQRQSITEDGYLMLTIARNLAIGNGFSVANGETLTNGTQPLCTVIFAGCFAVVGGDRLAGLYLVAVVQFMVAVAAAVLIYSGVRRTLYRGPHAGFVAVLAAVFWFVSPSCVRHTQNGLETGLATLTIVAAVLAYDRASAALFGSLQPARCAWIGLLAGLAFLARNDACLLIAALLGVHLWRAARRGLLGRAVAQAFVIGVVSILVASPWLYFNVTRFGHVVPVSGRAEALDVAFAHNFREAVPVLLESLAVIVRISVRAVANRAAQVAAIPVLLAVLVAALVKRRFLAARLSPGVGVLAAFVGALFTYYALFFGQPSFLSRYFFPAVLLGAVVLAAIAAEVLYHPRISAGGRAGVIALAALASMAIDARIYARGYEQGHFQAVDWVHEHVPDSTWVGAIQTGTLGFFHDRTINLDGKVNPASFRARRDDRLAEYVRSQPIEYLVDWAGIANWANQPGFSADFELLFCDHAVNLAVLQRKPRAPASSPQGPLPIGEHAP